MKHTKSILFAAATAALALTAPMASATPITLNANTSEAAVGPGRVGVTISEGSITNPIATAFRMTQVPGGQEAATAAGLANAFMAFCLDTFNALSGTGGSANNPNTASYTVTNNPFSTASNGRQLSGDQISMITRLFNVFSERGKVPTGEKFATPDHVAMQLALWEVVYETGASFDVNDADFFNVSTGDFTVSGGGTAGSDARATANDLLIAAGNLTDADVVGRWRAVFLQSDPAGSTQNLVTAVIPLPAPILMLLAAIAGLVGVRRFRKDAAA